MGTFHFGKGMAPLNLTKTSEMATWVKNFWSALMVTFEFAADFY